MGQLQLSSTGYHEHLLEGVPLYTASASSWEKRGDNKCYLPMLAQKLINIVVLHIVVTQTFSSMDLLIV